MSRTYDIMAVGECLVDIICRVENGKLLMEGNPGGAPANVLAIAGKMGLCTGMISKVGQDTFGTFLKAKLKEAGIGMEHVPLDQEHPTTLAMVQLDDHGDRSFTFYRNETAEVMMTLEELPVEEIKHTGIFHFGSVSLTAEPSRSATLAAAKTAKEAGVTVSYDPNLRPPLWNSMDVARQWILEGMSLADYVKMSEEELEFLTGTEDVETGIRSLFEQYPMTLLVVTMGANGCIAMTKCGLYRADALKVICVDTTGAGDAFWGALLGRLLKKGRKPEEYNDEQIRELLRFACVAGSLATMKKGAIPAMPEEQMILERMNRVCEEE